MAASAFSNLNVSPFSYSLRALSIFFLQFGSDDKFIIFIRVAKNIHEQTLHIIVKAAVLALSQ